MIRNSFMWSLGCLLLPAVAGAAAGEEVCFNRDVRPILSEYCFSCHGPDAARRKAGLRLDTREGATAALDGGAAVVPGDPAASLLLQRVASAEDARRMPPPRTGRRLAPQQIEVLRRWVRAGAPYQKHWSLIPPERPAVPTVADRAWPRNSIDRFVLARLEQEGLRPSPEAAKATLLRRVSLDLTGLPPTPQDLDAFLADPSPAGYEKVVDRLLASPAYGERMAQTWLDLARYADTNGYNNDEERTMWAWRDWVIDAFNDNLPYDRFVTEQIAGDLLPAATPAQKLATGFNRNHVITTEGGIIPEEYRVEYVADRVHTTAGAFLGLSLGCARCHDHKYDPISQKDYYRFFAFFNNIQDRTVGYNQGAAAEPYLRLPSRRQQAILDDLEARRRGLEDLRRRREASAEEAVARWECESPAGALTHLPLGIWLVPPARRTAAQQEQVRRAYLDTTDAEYRRLQVELESVARQKAGVEAGVPTTMVMQELSSPRPTRILKRGQYDQPGETVEPAVPSCLPPLPTGAPANRLGLARWLVDPANPLTARVAVNRWWQTCFGAGIVETAEDFGSQGAWPSHPELLDWLATELVRSQWDVKALQRLMVTSATYRQSSRVTPELLERDPGNRLLARGPRFRLPAETVRDNALAAAGLLVRQLGGPSVKPYQPAGLWEDVSVERRVGYKAGAGADLYRRSLYTYWKRTCPPPALTAFDAPDRETCVIRRARTNTPLQALVLLNDPTYVEAARKLAERALREGGPSPESRLAHAYRLAVSRSPRPEEVNVLLPILHRALDRFRGDPSAAAKLLAVGAAPRDPGLDTAELAAWSAVAGVLLNLDETITKE